MSSEDTEPTANVETSTESESQVLPLRRKKTRENVETAKFLGDFNPVQLRHSLKQSHKSLVTFSSQTSGKWCGRFN